MGFDEVDRSGDIVVEARKLAKAFDTPLFRDLSLTIERGECVGVIGPNGAGKTTLIKTLIGREKPDQGEVKIGHKVQVGYHDQGLQSLDPAHDGRPLGLARGRPGMGRGGRPRRPGAVRPHRRPGASRRSGSSPAARRPRPPWPASAPTGANLLVMDEPTNHLDIWSCDALERSINEFEGTVLVVSHDRYFLNQVADRLIQVSGGRARVIEGDYDTFQHLVQKEKELAPRPPRPNPPPRPPRAPPPDPPANGGEAQAEVPPSQGGRHRARDRRAGEGGRRPRRPARPAGDLARPRQGRRHAGAPQAAEGEAGKPLPALGNGARSQLVNSQSLALDIRGSA